MHGGNWRDEKRKGRRRGQVGMRHWQTQQPGKDGEEVTDLKGGERGQGEREGRVRKGKRKNRLPMHQHAMDDTWDDVIKILRAHRGGWAQRS